MFCGLFQQKHAKELDTLPFHLLRQMLHDAMSHINNDETIMAEVTRRPKKKVTEQKMWKRLSRGPKQRTICDSVTKLAITFSLCVMSHQLYKFSADIMHPICSEH